MLNHNLTDREKEIGACLIDGMSIKDISNKLKISKYTIEIHRRNINLKFLAKLFN